MSDTARVTDDAGESSPVVTVPTAGAVLAAATLLVLLVPSPGAIDGPAMTVAVAGSAVAAAAFLARRHGLIARRVGGSIAAAASLVVVLLAGYAITQGTFGSVALPGLGWSASTVVAAGIGAAAAVGIATADAGGVSTAGVIQRIKHTAEMLVLGAIGLLGITIGAILVATPFQLVLGELTSVQWTVVEYLGFGLGLGAVSAGYLAARELDASFVDLERPTPWTVGWIVLGLVALLATNVLLSQLMTILGIESSTHATYEQAAENPALVAVIVPAMVLIVGPFEELLYRNVVQKSLYDTFSRPGAVVVASVVFTLVHVLAYATAGADRILASLAMLFVLSLILGGLYVRTKNLLVPALVHGCYNAFVFVPLLL